MTKRKNRGQTKGRKHQNNNNGTGSSSYNSNHDNGGSKRPRHNSSGNGNSSEFDFDASKGYIDPTTGQRGAFPGLEGEPADFYGPASDGMDYLRMVRSEAKGVPALLVAGQKAITPPPLPILRSSTLDYDDDYDDDDEPEAVEQVMIDELEEGEIVDEQEEGEIVDEQGKDDDEQGKDDDEQDWYSDQTYTITIGPTAATPEPPTAHPIWHDALLTSFRSTRMRLHANPPTPPLPLAVSPSLPARKQRSLWQQHIFNTSPTPKELWGIDQQTVLRLLKWLTKRMPEMARHKSGRNWSQWLWGLLVRLDDCLTADEASIVRELGKRCLIIREHMAIALQEERILLQDERILLQEEMEGIPDDQGGEAEGDEDEGIEVSQDLTAMQEFDAVQEEFNVLQEFDAVQDEGTAAGPAAGQPEQVLDSPTAPNIETAAEPGVTPQHEAALETIPSPQTEGPAEVEAAKILAFASRLKATLQSLQDQTLQELSQSGQTHQPKLNAPVLETGDTLSQPDTFGALDMVISVVGDFYGQKDLLADRKTPIHF